jgi:hypothetical protein
MQLEPLHFITKTDLSKQCVGVHAFVRHFPHSTVPCGTCSACCRSDFDINLETQDDPTLYQTQVGPKTGQLSLAKTPDGACVYLQNDKCSIYDRRPNVCRSFDCRPDVLCGLKTSDLSNQAAWAKFDFTYKEPQDLQLREYLGIVMFCLVPLLNEGEDETIAVHAAIELVKAGLKRYPDAFACFWWVMSRIERQYRDRGLQAPQPEDYARKTFVRAGSV